MLFTAHDLRYHAAETYPALYAHLSHHAQRFLRSYRFDAFEVDLVVGHVVEQLVRLGLLGGEDKTPLTALDRFSDAQFYAFLNHSVRNKAIDRLRKRRLQVSSVAELETLQGTQGEDDPLNEVTTSLWGSPPFETPEEAALALASQEGLRAVLKHCIKMLTAAPHQLQAILAEIEEFGATELLHDVIEDLKDPAIISEADIPHLSQHKDHAHKKLRHCLQQKSSNLIVMIALRLTEYSVQSTSTNEFLVNIQTLAQQDLAEADVRVALKELAADGLVNWQSEEMVGCTSDQMKQLKHFYREE